MQKQYLTYDEIKWLYSHGGRLAIDAHRDAGGIFTFMADGEGGIEKVYIPKDYVHTETY